jgi:hypothetical protein
MTTTERPAIDSGIIFSPAMIAALIGGRKSATRRLASSPLAKLQPGDRLWVRESFRLDARHDGKRPTAVINTAPVFYEADGDASGDLNPGRLRPSIHLPRWASRLTLEVYAVQVERLHAMTDSDARAEGILQPEGSASWTDSLAAPDWWPTPREAFAALWDRLHDKPGERWADNPLIVAISFAVSPRNIDARI